MRYVLTMIAVGFLLNSCRAQTNLDNTIILTNYETASVDTKTPYYIYTKLPYGSSGSLSDMYGNTAHFHRNYDENKVDGDRIVFSERTYLKHYKSASIDLSTITNEDFAKIFTNGDGLRSRKTFYLLRIEGKKYVLYKTNVGYIHAIDD